MTPLTQQFVESCPVEGVFRMRGLEMTRIEVFVDAAFAFAVTMRVMAGGMFSWLSKDYLPSNFDPISMDELSHMFVFLGIGFIALCLVFVLMYRYAASLEQELRLGKGEVHETRTVQYMWLGAACIGALSAISALVFPLQYVPYAGFVYFLLGPWFPFVRFLRLKSRP